MDDHALLLALKNGEQAPAVAPSSPEPEWVDENIAAAFLGFAAGTLRQWRVTGAGPPYAKYGSSKQAKVRYSMSVLRVWANQRLRSHTSE